jgi:NTE family protein
MNERRAALGVIGLAAAAPWAVAPAQGVRPRRIAVALGSGGLHGLVYVGAIRAFQKLRFKPDIITGCSVGAIAAALWAAGDTADTIESVARDPTWQNINRWHMPRLGLADLKSLRELIDRLTGGARIESLEVPFAAVATNLATGRSEILQQGPLAAAVTASCSVPIRYEPVEFDGRSLVDGALTAPIPVDAARTLGADFVIAIDVAYRPYEEPVTGITDVAFQMFHIMVNSLIAEQVRRADYAIRLDVHALSQGSDHERALIRAGEEAVQAQWPALRKRLGR